jgi:hypothetical protein
MSFSPDCYDIDLENRRPGMIRQKLLFLRHADCRHPRLRPHAETLGMSVNWDPDLRAATPLTRVFSEVLRFDIGWAYAEQGVVAANARLVEIVRDHRPKYVLWPTMSYEIQPESFQEVRRLGAYVVGWFFDDECRFDDYSRWWIPCMDFVFTGDKRSVARYRSLGATALHLLVTADPLVFRPIPAADSYDISFVGSRSVADRDGLVERFARRGLRVSVFGKGWPSGFVSNERMISIYGNSKINLCFTKSYEAGSRHQLKNKIFDITMCGGFLLCEYAEGLEEWFVDGREIVSFRDPDEAVELAAYYLAHETDRREIACAGMRRARECHCQAALFQRAFGRLEAATSVERRRSISSFDPGAMSPAARRLAAQYHGRWAEVLGREGFPEWRVRDELAAAQRYEPVAIRPPAGGGPGTAAEAALRPFAELFRLLKADALSFLSALKTGSETGRYRYSRSTTAPNIYASVYALLILSLYGELEGMPAAERRAWVDYLDAFQSEADGLFYDPVLDSRLYADTDWWGARHFALHAIPAYAALKARPRHPFRFLERYLQPEALSQLLAGADWSGPIPHENDIDNRIMNVGSCLQYARDAFGDERAARAVDFLLEKLAEKINPQTGLWGVYRRDDPEQVSRMVQFGYHILSLYLYDQRPIAHPEKIIDWALATQNAAGGFGARLNSSACEDIDSASLLVRLSRVTGHRRAEVRRALSRALSWIVSNRSDDRGFVFRRGEAFCYGHPQMASQAGEGSMFATWFRTLCLAYIVNALSPVPLYRVNRAPGLEF